MSLVSIAVYDDELHQRRGRICRREDGLFQFTLERLTEETEEFEAYWSPVSVSGIYGTADEALAGLRKKMPKAEVLEGAKPVTMQPSGYWPDP